MTQDPQIIMKGLDCCSKRIPCCSDCPYFYHCKDLEPDASAVIKHLLSIVNDKDCLINRLRQDININLDIIKELQEERLDNINE